MNKSMNKNKIEVDKRLRRRARIRAKIKGTEKVPRLSVFRSLKQVRAQLIDDVKGRTLVSADSRDSSNFFKLTLNASNDGGKARVAYAVGELIALRALEKGIGRVVFDRGGYKYHGRVEAVAKGARKGGLKF